MLKAKDGQLIPCICVTNRKLCQGDFLGRIREIAREGIADGIVLREKDISEEEYYALAEQVLQIGRDYGIECVLHTFYQTARRLNCKKIHLPLDILTEMKPEDRADFEWMGSSVHSVEQAQTAVRCGADYVMAGHVFDTDCKKGLPGRGLAFIREIADAVSVPVYGIGGIDTRNASAVIKSGAQGICIMSGFMLESIPYLC